MTERERIFAEPFCPRALAVSLGKFIILESLSC